MQNLKESERSNGVVIFAFNTDIDYVGIADLSSRLISHNLKLPVTLITDINSNPKFNYDQVIRIDTQGHTWRNDNIVWRNLDRYLAYELSPYIETIVLDADYLVLDNTLLQLFHTEFDYRLMHHNITPDGPSYEMMGETSVPFIWATIVLFRKTARAKLFFNLVGRIQRNYGYYCTLYNVREKNYRNDYAFSMANIILNGYSINEDFGIPWNMFTINNKIDTITLTDNFLKIQHADNAVVSPYQNLHIMDKDYLQSTDFEQVVEAICEST